jgi:DNA-binding TFAR19-related protein (PDSD5 family)
VSERNIQSGEGKGMEKRRCEEEREVEREGGRKEGRKTYPSITTLTPNARSRLSSVILR